VSNGLVGATSGGANVQINFLDDFLFIAMEGFSSVTVLDQTKPPTYLFRSGG
jgi:hypothetical protein